MAARLCWRWPDSKKINQIPDTTQGSICMQLVSTRPHSGSHWGLVASPLSAFIGHVRQPRIVDYGHSPRTPREASHAIPDKCGDRRSGTGLGSGIHDTLNHTHKRSSSPRPPAFFPLRAAQRRSVRVCLFVSVEACKIILPPACHPPATCPPPARYDSTRRDIWHCFSWTKTITSCLLHLQVRPSLCPCSVPVSSSQYPPDLFLPLVGERRRAVPLKNRLVQAACD